MDLVAFGFPQSQQNQRAFDCGDQHRVEIFPGAVPHAFDEITDLVFEVGIQAQRLPFAVGLRRIRLWRLGRLQRRCRAFQDATRSH